MLRQPPRSTRTDTLFPYTTLFRSNAQVGLKVGGKSYKIELVAYDDKYQASEAVTAANRLIFEDKVKFIMGPMGGATALAIGPTVEKHGVLTTDRKSVVEGKSVSVRVELGGRRSIKKKTTKQQRKEVNRNAKKWKI